MSTIIKYGFIVYFCLSFLVFFVLNVFVPHDISYLNEVDFDIQYSALYIFHGINGELAGDGFVEYQGEVLPRAHFHCQVQNLWYACSISDATINALWSPIVGILYNTLITLPILLVSMIFTFIYSSKIIERIKTVGKNVVRLVKTNPVWAIVFLIIVITCLRFNLGQTASGLIVLYLTDNWVLHLPDTVISLILSPLVLILVTLNVFYDLFIN